MTDRKGKPTSPDTTCARCGHAQHLHALVNYADPFVGASVLVCPTSIYAPQGTP